MRPVIACLAAAIVSVLAMPSSHGLTARKQKLLERAHDYLEGEDRYVDGGVILYIVEKDPDGAEYLPGKPPLRIVGEERRGGIIDTRTRQIVADSEDPVVWFNSRAGAEIVLHGDHLPPKILEEAAMGAGKTTDIGQWLWFQALDLIDFPGEFGATAPTSERTTMIQQAIIDLWPEEWFRWKERDKTFRIATGHTIRLVSTHKASQAEGSRVQGYNWIRHVGDELQDCWSENGNIDARGRDAPRGIFKRLNSVTVKDDSGWRTHKAQILSRLPDGRPSPWVLIKKSGPDSPFVDAEHWASMRASMDDLEYRRKVLAEDVPSPKRIYYTWSRETNLRPVPRIGAGDVTREVLASFGPNYSLLAAHDPGTTVNYSLWLRAYRLANSRRHVWFVLGEQWDPHTTTEQHGGKLMQTFRGAPFNLHRLDIRNQPLPDVPVALLHVDPHADSGSDKSRPNPVLTTLKNIGLHAKPAAYAKPKQGGTIGASGPGQVPKIDGIKMIVSLFCNAAGERRLFIACDDRGRPVAPKLVEAIESQEWDGNGDAETQRKGHGDLSHPVATLRYALWRLEAPRHEAAQARGA